MEVAWNNWATHRVGRLLNLDCLEDVQDRFSGIHKIFSSTEDRKLTLDERDTIAAFICAAIECADMKAKRKIEITMFECYDLFYLLVPAIEAFVNHNPKPKEVEVEGK